MKSAACRAAALLTLAVVLGCQKPAPPAETQGVANAAPAKGREPEPGLIVVVVVDQFRADYLERFGTLWRGGFAQLRDRGVVVEGGRLLHAVSSTAPGHATLATGVHPNRHGIIGNQWVDRNSGLEVESVHDQEHGASPRLMLARSFADHLEAVAPRSRAFAVSGKDRGAIPMAGHGADGAFWYNATTGDMVTSDYYPHPSPSWLDDFNRDYHPRRHFAVPWTSDLLPAPAELTRLGIAPIDVGPLVQSGLPQVLGGVGMAPGKGFFGGVLRSPIVDELVADLARQILESEQLGQRDTLDVLTVSFSALDNVGHRWGMDSPEVLDTLLRLDVVLGELLAELERQVGRERLFVAMSADHGVMPVPEVRAARGEPLARISRETVLCIQQVDQVLDQTFGQQPWFRPDDTFDPAALAAAGVPQAEAARIGLAHLAGCPGVAAAWSTRDLLTQPVGVREESDRALWSHSAHPDRGGDLVVQFAETILPSLATTANHGSVYRFDRDVPMIFLFPDLPAGRLRGVDAATIDLAPTIAAYAGFPMSDVDGRPLALDQAQPN